MMNKIALILYYTKTNRYSFNALLGAIEAKNFDKAKIYFVQTKKDLFLLLREIENVYKKIIVAFSFFTTQIFAIKPLIKRLKKLYNKALYIAGGPHPTGCSFDTLLMGFDAVLLGEAEDTFVEFLERVASDRGYFDMKGIAFFNEKGNFICNLRDDFVNLDDYFSFSARYNLFGPIEITRGCPFGCKFCQTSYIFGFSYRHRSLCSILEHITKMYNKNNLDIRFVSPNAFAYGSDLIGRPNILAIEALLKSIKDIVKSNGRIFFGSFPSEVRPEYVNEDTISLVLKYANNDNLVIGAQSGSQRLLDILGRSHTIEDVYRAVKLIVKANLKAYVDFIFGLPNETEEDVLVTIKVMKDLIKLGAKIHAHTFMPLPQTPLANVKEISFNKKLYEFINQTLNKGVLFGSWQNQLLLAKKIINSSSLSASSSNYASELKNVG